MNLTRIFVPVFISIMLTSCATKPVSNSEASFVPENRIINSNFLERGQGKTMITVKRDSGWNTSACSVRVFLDGSPIADVRSSEKIVIFLEQGDYILSARANSICAGGLVEESLKVVEGKNLTYRIAYGSNGEFSLNPTAF